MRIIFISLVTTFWFLVCASNMAHSNDTDKISVEYFDSLPEGIESEPKRIKLMNVTKVRNKISAICSKFMNASASSDDKNYWISLENITVLSHLKQIEDILKKNKRWEVQCLVIENVPVLKANYLPKKLECNISLSNGSGVEKTKLILYIFELQPQALRLCHFIQRIMKLGGLGFKRYLVTMLVMFYLQKKKFLPSIKLAQSGLTTKEIDGWQLQFDPSREIGSFQGILILNDFKPHVEGFFQFYRSFNFAAHAAVPYLGREVSKQNYANCEVLKEFRFRLEGFTNNLPMAVTDSIKLDFNCAFDVGKGSLEKFVNFCGVAENLLAQYYRR